MSKNEFATQIRRVGSRSVETLNRPATGGFYFNRGNLSQRNDEQPAAYQQETQQHCLGATTLPRLMLPAAALGSRAPIPSQMLTGIHGKNGDER